MQSAARIYFERKRRVAFATWLAEHIVLPCVLCLGLGVLLALHLIPAPADTACDGEPVISAHEAMADAWTTEREVMK